MINPDQRPNVPQVHQDQTSSNEAQLNLNSSTPANFHFFDDAFAFSSVSEALSPSVDTTFTSDNIRVTSASTGSGSYTVTSSTTLRSIDSPLNALASDTFDEFVQLPETISESDIGGRASRSSSMDRGRMSLGTQSASRKRGVATASDRSAKRDRPKGINVPIAGFSETALRAYIEKEKGRHEDTRVPWKQPFADLPAPRSNVEWFAKHKMEVETLYFALGSPEAMASLQDMLQAMRNPSELSLYSRNDLTMHERLALIEDLEDGITLLGLLRRCHIYLLFQEYGHTHRQVFGVFVVQTDRMLAAKTKGKSGNPLFAEDSKLTLSMMNELYPGVQKGDVKYEKKYRFVTRLRQLGKRLSYMVGIFGFGILGLIPNTSMDTVLKVDDKMYVPFYVLVLRSPFKDSFSP